MCNPGVVSRTLACFYASAAVNCFEKKVNQFTAARTPFETRAAQNHPRCVPFNRCCKILKTMKLLICFLFLFFSFSCFFQEKETLDKSLDKKSDTVSFVAIINIKYATKDGIYLNGYVVNISYEEAKSLHDKKVRITGNVTKRKGLKDINSTEIQQGREEETKHIESPKIEIVKS